MLHPSTCRHPADGRARDAGSAPWWLIAVAAGALLAVSGGTVYGLRVRQRA